jgi:hypothetical protein
LDEDDIDGDGRRDDAVTELDIDGDGKLDDNPSEDDIDGDGLDDDDVNEDDIDGDGRGNGDADEDDVDGDGKRRGRDKDDDGDDIDNDDDDDDDNDGEDDDEDDDDDDGPGMPGAQVGDGNAPAALTGLAYLVSENGTQLPERLTFLTATTGRETDPTDIDPFTYTYTPGTTTATLRVQFKLDKWDDYVLNFAAGTFTRTEFDKSRQKDTDTGTFALPTS